jgi:hypothetical protein
MTCIFQFLSLCAIVLFMEETMYDRHLRPVPSRPSSGLRYRIETLFGVTGWRMAHYRTPLYKATYDMMDTFWRPQLILPCLYTGIMVRAPSLRNGSRSSPPVRLLDRQQLDALDLYRRASGGMCEVYDRGGS